MKKTLAYVNPDFYVDVDLTILKHLAKIFEIIWYPVYYTDRPIYHTKEQMIEYASKYGIQLHLCPRKYRQRDARNLRFYKDIVRDINSRNVDLVYSCIVEEIYWTLASWKLNAKRVLGLHDVVMHSFNQPLKRFIQTVVRELTIHYSRNVCVFSNNQLELFRKRHGRDAFELGLCIRDLGTPTMQLTDISVGVKLLFFGNIVQYKGLDLLIGTLEKLHSEGITNLHLTVAGNGSFWSVCEPIMKSPEMYDLKIRFIENDEIPDLMSSHHFLVLPYRNSTQSGPLMIAAGYGIPVVAPRKGCFTELYDDSSAVLYNVLEEALRYVSNMDALVYSSLRNGANLIDKKNSEDAIAEKYISCFKALI